MRNTSPALMRSQRQLPLNTLLGSMHITHVMEWWHHCQTKCIKWSMINIRYVFDFHFPCQHDLNCRRICVVSRRADNGTPRPRPHDWHLVKLVLLLKLLIQKYVDNNWAIITYLPSKYMKQWDIIVFSDLDISYTSCKISKGILFETVKTRH